MNWPLNQGKLLDFMDIGPNNCKEICECFKTDSAHCSSSHYVSK